MPEKNQSSGFWQLNVWYPNKRGAPRVSVHKAGAGVCLNCRYLTLNSPFLKKKRWKQKLFAGNNFLKFVLDYTVYLRKKQQ